MVAITGGRYSVFPEISVIRPAVSAGIHYSGDCVVVIDADLQDRLFNTRSCSQMAGGYQVVYAVRKRERGDDKKSAMLHSIDY